MPLTDADLIQRSWGEPACFAELFDRHFGAVRSFCARRMGRDDAEDLAGETFRRAFEHRHRYDLDREDARPWLYGIALNAIRNTFRSQGRRAVAFARLDVTGPGGVDLAANAASAVDARRDLAVVIAALRECPPDEVDALLLHVWEGLSYADIAVAFSVPVGTIKSRLNRVRGRLRELLDASGESSFDTSLRSLRGNHGS
jgi:RNA polymerase sigma-70 factor (ECF subfamily)